MTVELHFNRFDEWPAAREALPAAERAAREALCGRDAPESDDADHPDARDFPNRGEVSFTCLAADEIAELNRRYLERDRPTDVIAFPLSDSDAPPMGDVYLCPDVARESAEERGLPPAEEVVRLVTHGALHLLGHVHPEGEGRESSEMYRLQEEIVERAREESGGGHDSGAEREGENGP